MPKPTPLKLVQSGPTPPEPPEDLGEAGRRLWSTIAGEYDVTDGEGRFLLAEACRSHDRAEACRAAINRDGEAIQTRAGIRSHPLLRDEVAARALSVRIIARLELRALPVRTVGRPSGSPVVA